MVQKKIEEIVGKKNLLTDVPMSRYTTFRVGGNAAYLANVESEEILIRLIALLREEGMGYYLLGNGSNLLVSDQGYDGVIIRLQGGFLHISEIAKAYPDDPAADLSDDRYNYSYNYCHDDCHDDCHGDAQEAVRFLQAGAAVSLSKAAQTAAERGLTGLEFAYGIPGTVGGAIVMNAGAYGGEMRQVVESVRLLDGNLQIVTLKNDEMTFGYRTSILKKKPYVALSVKLRLSSGDTKEITAKMNDNMSARKEKQPLEYPSAGSTFKRPEGYFAGKLIQDAGLRGYRVGGAQVSEKHCGFVINTGNATASDIYHLIMDVRDKVRETSGVTLEPEVIFLGNFNQR